MNVIQEFLADRKAKRIKSKLKTNMTPEEEVLVEEEAKEKFLLDNWLPDAAKRAGQLFMVSHPSKFSHPSSKTSSILASAERSPDGFLRTGNVETELDVFGNAAALDVHQFLSLTLDDGKTVLEHVEAKTETIQKMLTVKTATFAEIRTGLLATKSEDSDLTSGKVKQVYFPVGDDYHLLSLLTSSGIAFGIKNRINTMRFSDQAKEARAAKKKGEFHAQGFDEYWGLAAIGYGGTKPQNISALNSKNGGTALLLPSMPPTLEERTVRLPKVNFFKEVVWPHKYKESFETLGKLFKTLPLEKDISPNNFRIRKERDDCYLYIVDRLMDEVWQIRAHKPEGALLEGFAKLPLHQKIWLYYESFEEQEISEEWLSNVMDDMARWIIVAYNKVVEKRFATIGDEEMVRLRGLIEKHKEGLR